MIVAVHWFLALVSATVMGLAGIEAGARAVRSRPPGAFAARVSGFLLFVLGLTAAGGLGLFMIGGRPHETLHLLYGVLAVFAGRLFFRSAGKGPATIEAGEENKPYTGMAY